MVINAIQNQLVKRIEYYRRAIGNLNIGGDAKTHKASIQEVKSSIQMWKYLGVPEQSNINHIKENKYADQGPELQCILKGKED